MSKKTKAADAQAAQQQHHRDDPWLDIKEVAVFCNVTHWTVRRWIVNGVGRAPRPVKRLRAAWVGGRQKVRQSALDAFLGAA